MYRITHQYLTLNERGTSIVMVGEDTCDDWTGITPIVERMLRFSSGNGSITTITISINLTQPTWI